MGEDTCLLGSFLSPVTASEMTKLKKIYWGKNNEKKKVKKNLKYIVPKNHSLLYIEGKNKNTIQDMYVAKRN